MAWTEQDQQQFEADSFERIARNLGLVPSTPNYRLDAKERNMMADVALDLLGKRCLDCGGIKDVDTTPKWVYREREICECEDTP